MQITEASEGLRPLSEIYVDSVCGLHMRALAGEFLPSLGERFLKTLYRAIIDLKAGFGCVYVKNGRVAGFVLGSLDTGRLFRRVILSRGAALSRCLLGSVVKTPSLIKNIMCSLLYPAKGPSHGLNRAELVVIAVDEAFAGQGIGSRLVAELNREFLENGIREYRVTVTEDNIKANKFYQRLGFEPKGSFTLFNKRWNSYLISLKKG